MKKFFALLFIGTTLTFAACQPKPKTEETSTSDSTMTTSMMDTDSASMGTDSTTGPNSIEMMGDSASSMTTTTQSTTAQSTTN